jgi:hypothetical protein
MLFIGDEAGEARAIIIECWCWRPRGRNRLVSADSRWLVKALASGVSCCRCRLLVDKKCGVNVSIDLVLSGSREGCSMQWWL